MGDGRPRGTRPCCRYAKAPRAGPAAISVVVVVGILIFVLTRAFTFTFTFTSIACACCVLCVCCVCVLCHLCVRARVLCVCVVRVCCLCCLCCLCAWVCVGVGDLVDYLDCIRAITSTRWSWEAEVWTWATCLADPWVSLVLRDLGVAIHLLDAVLNEVRAWAL
jgi:hypothetical protein